VLLVAPDLANEENRIDHHAGDDHQEEDRPEDHHDRLAPVQDEPADVQRDGRRDQADAEDREEDGLPLAPGYHGCQDTETLPSEPSPPRSTPQGSLGPTTAASRLVALACALSMLSGCAMLKRKAIGTVADTLASSGDVFTRDDDLELVGQAIPFGLKLYESLLDSSPTNKDLLIATCSNFTQYGVAYLETEPLVLGETPHHAPVP